MGSWQTTVSVAIVGRYYGIPTVCIRKLDSLRRFKREINGLYNNCQSGPYMAILQKKVAVRKRLFNIIHGVNEDFTVFK